MLWTTINVVKLWFKQVLNEYFTIEENCILLGPGSGWRNYQTASSQSQQQLDQQEQQQPGNNTVGGPSTREAASLWINIPYIDMQETLPGVHINGYIIITPDIVLLPGALSPPPSSGHAPRCTSWWTRTSRRSGCLKSQYFIQPPDYEYYHVTLLASNCSRLRTVL